MRTVRDKRQHGEAADSRRHQRRGGWVGDSEPPRDKAIAAPRHRLNEAGSDRVVSQGEPETADGRVQAVLEIDERALRPEAATQFFARDDLPRVLQERGKNPERLVLERQAKPALAQLPRVDVD